MTEIHRRWGLPYCRVSSKRQEQEGSGLESQEIRLRDHCKEKRYPVVRSFRDTFTGGGDFMERPAMRELLAFVDEHPLPPGECYVVVFDDLKRFARDVEFHWRLRKAFRSRGVEVECLNFNFDESPEGRFVETVLAGAGQLERDQNRRQVIQKMQARLRAGYWAFPAPPGYRYEKSARHGKHLVPDEPAARFVREAFEGFASGRFRSQADVQRFLGKQEEIPHANQTSVRRLLTRRLYTGTVEHAPWGITRRKGHHEALVSPAVFEQVQERLDDRTPRLTRKDYRPEFPLRGFIACASCMRLMTASFSRGYSGRYPYYRCKTQGCPGYPRSIRRKDVEEAFEDLLSEITPKPLIVEYTHALADRHWQVSLADVEGRRRRLEDEETSCDEEIARLAARAARTDNDDAAAAYEARIAELSGRREVLAAKRAEGDTFEPRLGTALEHVLGFIKNPCGIWASRRYADRRALLGIAFAGSTPYDPATGFGTPNLSPGLALMKDFEDCDSLKVDLAHDSLNGVPSCRRGNAGEDQERIKKLLDSRWEAFERWVLDGHQILLAKDSSL